MKDRKCHEEDEQNLEREVQQIRAALHGLQNGSVTAVLQDGVLIQIERVERQQARRKQDPDARDERT